MSNQSAYSDSDGQPASSLRARENVLKTVEHLLGLCRGILADGEVSVCEIDFLATWLANNARTVSEHRIGRLLLNRVGAAVQDGQISAEELAELKECLEAVLGGGLQDDGGAGGMASAVGTQPAGTKLEFSGKNFVVTGKFLFGPRRVVESEIERRGGRMMPAVSSKVHYVVVGTMGSRDWSNSSFGNKLEKVYELVETGVSIQIIAEPDWVAAL